MALFQYSTILMTWKALLKSQPAIRTHKNLLSLTLFWLVKPRSFQHSCVIETGLSDFHRMAVTIMKTFFKKRQPKVVNCRDYKYFENDKFRTDLLSEFVKANIKEKENRLDIHAPRK